MNKILSIFIILFVFTHCNAQKDKQSNKKVPNKRTEKQIAYFKSKNIEVVENKEPLNKDQYEFCITDSIVVKMDSIRFYFYDFSLMQKDNIIFAQGAKSAGYLISSNGTMISQIGNIGTNLGEYQDGGFKLIHNKDSIFIASSTIGKVFLYNSGGKFIKSWKFKNVRLGVAIGDRLFITRNKKNEPIISVTANTRDFSDIKSEFYDKTFLMASLNLVTEETITALQYESESPYKLGLSYLTVANPCVNKSNNDNWVLNFKVDELIYEYDKTFKLIRVINPNSDNFPEPQGVRLEDDQKNYMNDLYKYGYRLNANNLYASTIFTKKENYLVKYYSIPIGDGTNTPNNINEFNTGSFVQDRKLQIFTKEGKKYCTEILIPKKLNNLQYAESLDKMYFTSNPKLTENNVIYVAKICKK